MKTMKSSKLQKHNVMWENDPQLHQTHHDPEETFSIWSAEPARVWTKWATPRSMDTFESNSLFAYFQILFFPEKK